MQELKSGCYLIKNNQVIPKKYNILDKTTAIRFISKDFSKVDINRFNNCVLWCSNTPINLDIEIYQLAEA